ncbi:MAG: LysR family transcriptional regulator [Richelia sp. RM1_1_1]|nr:LysR family transcriptional regulator [Richelia sp. RM1_1_1]
MELRQLKYFVTTAQELSFRRAAECLFMEQPPLSRQIRKLENELGVELFHRSKRGVTLTEAGHAFFNEARLTLAQAERAAKTAQEALQVEKLSIGFSICTFNRMLPDIIKAFRQQFPDVVVTLTEMSSDAQIQAILNGSINIGFIYTTVSHTNLVTFTLLNESLVVALPSDHPLIHQQQIDLKTLANEPFVLFPEPLKPDMYAQIIQLCEQSGFQPNVVQEASPPEVLLSFVASGMGISLVARGLELRHNIGIVYRPLTVPTPIQDTSAVWRKQSNSSTLKNFLTFVKSYA